LASSEEVLEDFRNPVMPVFIPAGDSPSATIVGLHRGLAASNAAGDSIYHTKIELREEMRSYTLLLKEAELLARTPEGVFQWLKDYAARIDFLLGDCVGFRR
jgi:hypothetical protein